MSLPPDRLAPPAGAAPSAPVAAPRPGPDDDDSFLGPWEPRNRPWYRRWPLWAAVVVAVVVAASVISDLPRRSTRADKVAMTTSVLKQINTDLHPCAFAASQSFSIYRRISNGTFPAADRSLVGSYLTDDQKACSYSDQSIYSVSTITVPNFAAGSHLSSMITTVLNWATSDAVGAIIDIETLVKHPGAASERQDLAKRESSLAVDRAEAERQWHAAAATLGTPPLPPLGLPSLPRPQHEDVPAT